MAAQNKRFLIVGGGKMGEGILSGWLGSSSAPADEVECDVVEVVEPGAERRAYLTERYHVTCLADVAEVEHVPDVVVLSVKPQVMMNVLAGLAPLPAFQTTGDGPLFISIAAGLTTASLEAALPHGAALVRVMPNMPLAIGAGASGVCGGAHASEGQVAYVASLFDCLGKAVVVEESDMDAVCAVSGSGPAYVAAMVEALRDAGVAQGLDAELAETLALQTVLGTARLIDEGDQSVADVRISICSPGGTTLAALEAMEAAGFAHVFDEGVAAAVRRSKELASCSR